MTATEQLSLAQTLAAATFGLLLCRASVVRYDPCLPVFSF